jgi:undecaprenyl-diphosphatase
LDVTWFQIIVTALLQGITEMFPVSSVGHAVILPYLVGWTNISESEQFLPFVVMLHLGTAIALLWYFRRDWVELIASLFRGGQAGPAAQQRRILFLIIVATVPAAVIGKLFEHKLRALFPSALSAAIFLVVNGIVLLIADRLRRKAGSGQIENLSYLQSFGIGLVQSLALIPGFSRSGVTMAAGLASGLSYEQSARFSFLLATPIILGAGVLEVPKVIKSHEPGMLGYGIVGGLLAGLFAYLATAFLMRYFKTHEVQALRPFAFYCMAVGAIVAVLSLTGIHL